MPIGLGSGLWAYVAPIDATNIATNPNFEFGNAGVTAIQAATLGTTSQFQRYGAWSLKVTPSSNGTSGAIAGTWSSGIGTTYSVSMWAFVESGVPMRIAVGDGNGLNLTSGSVTFTGGGTWQWYNTGIIEVSAVNRSLVIQKTSGNSQLPFYVDGVMINPWTDSIDRVISYFDGDTGGGTWTGAQHASQSTRSGQYRGGGSIIALADLGFSVDQMLGVGVSPIENSAQSYAVTDGAQFQRQRAATRKFTLTAKPIVGTSLADFHATRRTIWDAFKPDAVTPQQPTRLLYYGAQGTQYIDAFYDKGLELGNMDGPMAENAAISFVSYDPYWYAPTQQGTTLAPRTALGSTNFIARRSPLGKWGTMGPAGSSVDAAVYAITPSNGTIFVGGEIGSAAGTRARGITQYFPTTNTFGSLTGGTLGGTAYAILAAPWGSIIVAGSFTGVGGTAGAKQMAQWNGNWGTLIGGTAEGAPVRSLALNAYGTMFFGGDFTQFAGTNRPYIGKYQNSTGAFGSLTNGTPNNIVLSLALDQAQKLYIGGQFTLINGTAGTGIAQWDGNYGTLGAGLQQGGITGATTYAADIVVAPNQRIYVGGHFGTAGLGSAQHIASWNGVQFSPLGQGLGTTGNTSSAAYSLMVGSQGDIYAGGVVLGTTTGAIPFPDSAFHWQGASWVPLDINFNGIGYIYAWAATPDGAIYAGGSFAGTAQCASVGTIVNAGRAIAYPMLRLRNLSTGTARAYQLLNTLTNANVYFNYVMQPGEQALLTLQPGARSFQSSALGNIFGLILPGSNLASLNLLPGTNYVSFFSDNDSLEAALFWTPSGLTIDSGTVL